MVGHNGYESKLTRQTYHVEQRYIDAVKQEADRTGESQAPSSTGRLPAILGEGNPWGHLVDVLRPLKGLNLAKPKHSAQ